MSLPLIRLAEVDSTQSFLRRHPGLGFCAVVADTFKKAANYNCGSANCSQSAYVQDNCNGINYCWK